ncbi:type IV pilin [Halostella sp. JP-L12]|uniref:type IV pilin n=1 Tax=Halostella TaxID=1843185 RepID=UPI000EF830C5|nr:MULTISPECIES: type IV pilin N-terminal domain-containing protein [Halostella]NHN48707.1 type IV pilin [Halostella sp. JP-L12]
MQLKRLFTDDGAVSSVLAVVLMIAVAIVLGSLVGLFVFDIADKLRASPQMTFDFSQNESGGTHVEILYESGDNVEEDQVNVTVNGYDAVDDAGAPVWDGGGEVGAGDSVVVHGYDDGSVQNLQSDDEIRITWTSNDGDSSATVGEYTVD